MFWCIFAYGIVFRCYGNKALLAAGMLHFSINYNVDNSADLRPDFIATHLYIYVAFVRFRAVDTTMRNSDTYESYL